jgi:CubicO group peptidase (beta-lactamase class C family)
MVETSGKSFPSLMHETLLRPAGMSRSSFALTPVGSAMRNAASGHSQTGAAITGGSHKYPELAAAGLWTTPSDYGLFLIALQNAWAAKPGALLRPETARAMMTPVAGEYGLGIIALQREGRLVITHGGTNEGFQCRFMAFLDGSRQGLVIMTNGDDGGRLAAGIQRTLSEAYGWPDTLGPPPPQAPEA